MNTLLPAFFLLVASAPVQIEPVNSGEMPLNCRLVRKIPEVQFNDTSIQDFAQFFRDVSQQEITVDWDALKAIKIDRKTTASLTAKNLYGPGIADQFCKQLGDGKSVAFLCNGKVFLITSRVKADELLKKEPVCWMAGGALHEAPGVLLGQPETKSP